jgi:hypothetical protein
MAKKVIAETVPTEPTTGDPETTPVAVAVRDGDEPQRDIIPHIWACCCEAGGLFPIDSSIMSIANVVAGFVLQHRDAPPEAALMQVKLALGAVLFPNEDPRKVQLVIGLFRMAILGLNDMQRADDEAELARLDAERRAAAPAGRLCEEEHTLRAAGGPLHELSDFGKAMPGAAE